MPSEERPPRASLAEMLQVAERGAGRHAATLESFWGETTPGDLVARAVLCAAADGRLPAAAQSTFLGLPPPDVEIALATEDLAPDLRRVTAQFGDERLAEVTLRSGPLGGGLDYQSDALEPGLPAPEDLPAEAELAAQEGWGPFAAGPVESRRVGEHGPVPAHAPSVWQGWLAPREPLPDDARVHAAAIAFLSEYRSHWAVERRLGAEFPRTDLSVLNHTLWLHRHARWTEFWLVRTSSSVGVGGRCLSRREIFTRDGELLASAAWESFARPHHG